MIKISCNIPKDRASETEQNYIKNDKMIIKMFRRLFWLSCFAIGICSYSFIELSTAHLLKKKPEFYHSPMQRHSLNKLCCKRFERAGISVFNILTIISSFLNEIRSGFFPQKWSARKALQSLLKWKVFCILCIFYYWLPMEVSYNNNILLLTLYLLV
jgi:hypothetical protein